VLLSDIAWAVQQVEQITRVVSVSASYCMHSYAAVSQASLLSLALPPCYVTVSCCLSQHDVASPAAWPSAHIVALLCQHRLQQLLRAEVCRAQHDKVQRASLVDDTCFVSKLTE
jgi:hypothetical protein